MNISPTERQTCERYGEHVIGTMLAGGFAPKSADLLALYQTEETRQHARDWLTERADFLERQERWVSGRDFVLEIVIIALIGWEIYEGHQQSKVLQHMDSSTANTASAMQAARDSLKLLADTQKQEQAERSKKPKFELYLGSTLINQAAVRLAPRAGSAQDSASLELLLKNGGNAPANPSQIHVLVPENVYFELSPIQPAPEEEEPAKPATRRMSYGIPLIPVGKALRIHANIGAPKGHAAFKAFLTITTPQLETVASLGSLKVLPPNPQKNKPRE